MTGATEHLYVNAISQRHHHHLRFCFFVRSHEQDFFLARQLYPEPELFDFEE
jgi:hypothetical protein